ncbi:hypothetical protein [Breoghania sp. L-A4]|uniref:hypothetical protein n=1 Tax=Breoghania sp. L-A4 TaxID=2304600 RepID=UPI000E35A411|nr:hypothetical protein [Breoghania sp. L-A4]AXS40880.1 hypothetical protein D1F64_13575 [Breoghania sp. L-A4]
MMQISAKSKAEEKFAATQKKADRVLQEDEKIRRDRTAQMAKLKALRLAKEAEDLIVAEKVAAEKAAAKAKKPKRVAKATT